MKKETRKMILVAVLCGLGFMMYSVDRMVLSSTILFINNEFSLSPTSAGILLSAFFYGFIAFLFISGVISDRFSGKPVLIFGILTFSITTALTGLAGGFISLLIFRVLTGIGEGFFWPAASLEVANVTPEKYRTTVMSLYWSGYPIGSFFGVWLGSHIGATYGWRTAFYIAGALGIIISVLYGLLVKHEAKDAPNQRPQASHPATKVTDIFRNRSIILMSLYFFFILSGWWVMLLWAPTFLIREKMLSPATAGTIASLLGITGAVGGFFLGRLCDKISFASKRITLIVVTLLTGIIMALLVSNLSMPLVIIAILLLGLLGYPITPMILSFTAEVVPGSQRGAAIGFVTNMGMLAGAVSPVLVGYYSEKFPMATVWLVASLMMAISFIFLIPIRKTVAQA